MVWGLGSEGIGYEGQIISGPRVPQALHVSCVTSKTGVISLSHPHSAELWRSRYCVLGPRTYTSPFPRSAETKGRASERGTYAGRGNTLNPGDQQVLLEATYAFLDIRLSLAWTEWLILDRCIPSKVCLGKHVHDVIIRLIVLVVNLQGLRNSSHRAQHFGRL